MMCGFYQPTIPPLPSTLSLAGKTIIVTGGARGIGYTASLQLLQRRLSTLVLAVRSIDKGKAAAASLLRDPEVQRANPNARIEVINLDLARFSSVKDFVDQVESNFGSQGIDVLLLNAGVNLARWETTVDGYETLIQINYLSNALLSLLLLPLLTKSPSPHPTITLVSSMGQNFTSLSPASPPLSEPILPYFSDPTHYSKLHRYPDSKLFIALFVREFAKHLERHGGEEGGKGEGKGRVVVNCVCPGTTDTEADDALPWWLRVPMNFNRRLRARSVGEGAAAILKAAVGMGVETRGGYVANGVLSPLAPVADTEYGRAFGEKLWRETVEVLGGVDGRVRDVVAPL